MSIYDTPRHGMPSRRLVHVHKALEPQSLEELIGLHEGLFNGLDQHEKKQVIVRLHAALDENRFPFTDLKTADQFHILDFLFNHEDEHISLFLKTVDIQQKFMPLIDNSNLNKGQKIHLAVRIMIMHGKDVASICHFLTHGERQEALDKFRKKFKEVFPNVIVPSEFEEIKKFAFAHFSGIKRVPASPHHFVLVGLLYAQDPDIDAIQHVAYKYLHEQRSYFCTEGFSEVVRQQDVPVVSSDYSRFRPGMHSVNALHPGGVLATQSFLANEISSVDVDDEVLGLRVYPIASVRDEKLVRRAQIIAAQNMDFPAFLKISHVLTNEIDYNDHTGVCRIYSSVCLSDDDYEIVPLQPVVNCPTKERLERWYSREYAERIYRSIQNPIQIQNPEDPLRRVLFPDVNAAESPIVGSESATNNDKQFLYFIFKCLLGLIVLKIGFHIFEYFRAKFTPE